jgi:hypothetical protein
LARRELTLNDHRKFQIDERGQLIWDGQAVVLEQRFTLGWWELRIAGLASIAALIGAVFPIGIHFRWW